MRPVYLDNAATTAPEPEVIDVVRHFLEIEYGNSGSRTHSYGSVAAAGVETARRQIAEVVSTGPEDVIFTSGATEANNLAILGLAEELLRTGKQHAICTAVEHKAVLEPFERLQELGIDITMIDVDETGRVSVDAVSDALRTDTGLVSIMQVNNETGCIQPIDEIASTLEAHDAWFHVDAAQGFGKELVTLTNERIDLMSVSAHKIYGPKGVGALISRARGGKTRPPLKPLIVGGGQERGLRAGTLPVALVAGFGKAAELCVDQFDRRREVVKELSENLSKFITDNGGELNGSRAHAIPHILNASFPGLDSEAFMVVTKDSIAVSNGAACSSANYTRSHVLEAMGISDARIASAIRFSVSHNSSLPDLDQLGQIVSAFRL